MGDHDARATGAVEGQVVDHEGHLWKPAPGATASFADFIAARHRIVEISEDRMWNPWDRDALQQEQDRLIGVAEQWTRAEPGFRQWTQQEFEQHWQRRKAERDAEAQRRDKERAQRARQYDPAREAHRLDLLEQQSILRHRMEHAAELEVSPSPRWQPYGTPEEAQRSIERLRERVDRLRADVGDPETVADATGRLPAERRQNALVHFGIWREQEVTDLRNKIDQARSDLKAADKAERSKIRSRLHTAEYCLNGLLTVPRPTAEQMCSECFRPQSWDRWRTGGDGLTLYTGPCPAWPGWAKRIERAREMLRTSSSSTSPAAATPKPQPLAVIPSGLPIAEVVTRLTELQAQFPDGQVKRGRANKWEIWPPS